MGMVEPASLNPEVFEFLAASVGALVLGPTVAAHVTALMPLGLLFSWMLFV